jgi:hypothetical protein
VKFYKESLQKNASSAGDIISIYSYFDPAKFSSWLCMCRLNSAMVNKEPNTNTKI